MSKKRSALKYALAGSQVALMGASLWNVYSKIGQERPPYSLDELKKAGVVVSVFSVITFAVAKL